MSNYQTRLVGFLAGREKRRLHDHEYHLAHREEILKRKRERYRKNPEPTAKRLDWKRRNQKKYQHEWRQQNKDRIREYRKLLWHTNEKYREKVYAYIKKRNARVKAEVFAHYGGKCVCCGETKDVFLTIDHKDSGGNLQKKIGIRGSGFYLWIKRNNFPDNLQILCYNCNCGRYRNGGICPHRESLS